jgi:hypothetical protein
MLTWAELRLSVESSFEQRAWERSLLEWGLSSPPLKPQSFREIEKEILKTSSSSDLLSLSLRSVR